MKKIDWRKEMREVMEAGYSTSPSLLENLLDAAMAVAERMAAEADFTGYERCLRDGAAIARYHGEPPKLDIESAQRAVRQYEAWLADKTEDLVPHPGHTTMADAARVFARRCSELEAENERLQADVETFEDESRRCRRSQARLRKELDFLRAFKEVSTVSKK